MSVVPSSSVAKVAIGLPVYNGERYLEETLDSVLSQTFDDFDLFIADNASTDRTETICRDYASRDHRIHYIRNPLNLGAAKNYTCCFQPAKAPYFRWQNADDPIEPTLIERCVSVLDSEPEVILAYGKSKIIDENGLVTSDYEDNLNLTNPVVSQRFKECIHNIGLQNLMYGLIRRDVLERTALLGDYLASDINLIGELSLYGQFREIPEHLFNRRMHPQASSWDRKDIDRQKDFWNPAKRRLVMQTWRSIYEFYKAVYQAPIPLKDKAIISRFLIKRAYWHKTYMKNELVDLIRFGILKG
ncbi:glycosyltransferase family 2 protein [Saccharospirillum salsuginis]|uniref:Glycosyl transferase n=1 Tax=Saccharospirillum salsuginis TaxID=418750 RepID=A0A918N911_9GAMM|nr:glycosyltransferase family 2 protein [Saccharospirillum salsuginis]GGX49644.1 glycosyl transferase [Saccharospirillum salsuginis]